MSDFKAPVVLLSVQLGDSS